MRVTNSRVAGDEVDFLWPDLLLALEVDGYAYHGHRAAFERDRRKGMALEGAGYALLRVSWRQMEEEPLAVAASLARAIQRRVSRGGASPEAGDRNDRG